MISMLLSEAAKSVGSTLSGEDIVFSGCSTDSRTIEKGNLFIALKGEYFDGHEYVSIAEKNGASSLIVDSDVSNTKPFIKVKNTRKAMGLLAKSWREKITIPLVAITGSNGKTTVKEMVTSILSTVSNVHATSGNLNNDIGVPKTLFGLNESHSYAVIEMGANHLGEIEWLSKIASPNIAVITQCAPAHLEGFTDIKGVAKAKGEILQGKLPPKYACLNYDDKYYDLWCEMAKYSSVISFGFNPKASVFAKDIEVNLADHISSFTLVLPDSSTNIELPVVGKHNIMNACAAAAVMYSLSMPIKSIKQGLEIPLTVPGRLNFLKGIGNHCVIDDSYNANPTSTNAAIDLLSTMKDYKCLVMGDMKELGKDAIEMHSLIGLKAKESGVDRFLGIGDMMKYSVKEFGDNGYWFNTVDQLLCHLHKLIEDAPKMNILVKGSRSMRMDKIIKEII